MSTHKGKPLKHEFLSGNDGVDILFTAQCCIHRAKPFIIKSCTLVLV